ncbi:hypothetical protein [Hydrogenimonas thermophila]|uniref:Uncharacterized protein n=1 Tax=Hydrogenimonas thermophila TaxID=223786 RepID=A0A1I5LIJ0_9BACT|nr:hypothetical protein [Hydrogenimonas thermophila]SFO97025.1 hypothetical protein SAMN05216234_10344 [Hydrogenimonas thermophila]
MKTNPVKEIRLTDFENDINRIKGVANTLYFLSLDVEEMLEDSLILLHQDLLKIVENAEKVHELIKQTIKAN